MSEMSAGIRFLEMHERQTYYRDRAKRERGAGPVGESRRRLFRTRVSRPAA